MPHGAETTLVESRANAFGLEALIEWRTGWSLTALGREHADGAL